MDTTTQSMLLQYLPAIFHRKPPQDQEKVRSMGQFLLPFQQVTDSFDEVLAVVDRFFSPSFAPAEDFLPWLATWIALVLDEEWDEDKRRRLLDEAMGLYQWRGTVYGMKRYLEIYTGLGSNAIDIHEGRWPAGMQIGVCSRIGFRAGTAAAASLPEPIYLFHRHPRAELPPEQRLPNIRRWNDLTDLVAAPMRAVDIRQSDYYLVDTVMPTDLPPGTDPARVPAEGPLRIIYRAETIEEIKLEDAGVRVRYRPRAPEGYPDGAFVGGTFFVKDMEQAYSFIVTIRGLFPSLDEAADREQAEKVVSKIRIILDAEKPAYTRYCLQLTPAFGAARRRFMQIGVRSSVGLDTTLS